MDAHSKSPRKKWSEKKYDKDQILRAPKRHERMPFAKQVEPPSGYEEYLLLLQQRNKMIQKVKLTDKDQVEKERKERGFALYVNGANAEKVLQKKTASPSPRVTSKSRLESELSKLEKEQWNQLDLPPQSSRSRSAPEKHLKTSRKNWNTSSVNIKTARGEQMHISVPGSENIYYSEDFEEPTITEASSFRQAKPVGLVDDDDDDDDVTISDHILLTIDDVTKLRKSLELSGNVRESICKDIDEDSDIDEEIIDSDSTSQLSSKDIIVLEFSPSKSPRKSHTVKDPSSNKSGMKEAAKNRDETIELVSEPSDKKYPRPLSAVKKTAENNTIVSKEHRDEVLSAVEGENKRVSDYLQNRNTNTNQPRAQSPLVNSFMLVNEDDFKNVESRVLELQPSQQRDLLKSLYQLEKTVRPSSTAAIHPKNTESVKVKDKEVHKVHLDLMSNWGHDSLIGLTEIDLFNECNEKIDMNTSFLRLDGARNCKGDISNLFNSKCKTVKERNMFCCEKSGHRPISLSFRVEIPLGRQINKIKIWNYNKSLVDLGIGVRQVRISIDDDVIYDGEIDKGCGNQVFDYGHTIVLGSDGLRSNMVTPVSPPPNGFIPTGSNVSETRRPLARNEKRSKRLHHPDHKKVRNSKNNNSLEMWVPLSKTPEAEERSQTRTLNKSTDDLVLPSVDTDSDADIDCDSKKDEKNLKNSVNNNNISKPEKNISSRLPWMENSESCKSVSQKVLSTQVKPGALSDWLIDSKNNPLQSSLDNMLDDLDKWDLQPKREDDLKTMFDGQSNDKTSSDKIPTEVASENEEANYRETASQEISTSKQKKPIENLGKAESRRKRWRQSANNLEASWSSLDVFDKSHKGRLSMEGDALEEYLKFADKSSNSPNPNLPTSSKLTNVLESIAEDLSEQFIIPELPKGKHLVINIKSTWGDKYYTGLNGIELFSDTGEPIVVSKITADPSDINVLPEYKNDPRIVDNLLDGINRTRDDTHMWLAPFTEGSNHFICLTFTRKHALALLRIWNYNKSRIHSYRGAKDIEISLDGRYIFKGEIARACGGTQGGTEAFGDTILFTTSEEILEAVSRHDGQYDGGELSDQSDEDLGDKGRPATAEKGRNDRPLTSVAGVSHRKLTVQQSIKTSPANDDSMKHNAAIPVCSDGSTLVYRATQITLDFTETWGDRHYLGLTGLEVVAKDGEAIPVDMSMIDAVPRDLHVLEGYERDDRTLDKVIDGVNITVSDEHMWLIPFTEGSSHTLTIKFNAPKQLVGLRFWNYNKSPEDTYRGAKTVHVLLDSKPLSPSQGFLIRKGPGNCYYDFAQELLFSDVLQSIQSEIQLHPQALQNSNGDDPSDNYILSQNMPRGFVYQLHLMSSHGDLYYIGLNFIEFYGPDGSKISLDENNLAAYPESINVLDGVCGDVRTPDKLISARDESCTDNMWLAPILPSITNRLFVIFDYPQTISMIKIWNYSKTPNRGVKDFALLVDDLLVYNGALDTAKFGGGILPNTMGPQSYNTILFTTDDRIKRSVQHTIVSNVTDDLDVQLTNDNTIVSKSSLSKMQRPVDQALRPKTSLKKPTARKR